MSKEVGVDGKDEGMDVVSDLLGPGGLSERDAQKEGDNMVMRGLCP